MRKLLLGLMTALTLPGAISRVKDLASLEGVRDNQLVGYGLVVGLNGTGDKRQTVFAAQSLANMLNRMGVSVNPTALQAKNVAAVMVTATLPPFAQPGTRIDVTVGTVGDASNLQGGQLLLTSLRGADGQVYAVAQGGVLTAGFVGGRAGNSQTVNHPTAGRVPSGAIVEQPAPSVITEGRLRWQLLRADFTTATRLAAAINTRFAPGKLAVARASNAGIVEVETPPEWKAKPVEFIAAIEGLTLDSDRKQRLLINERTGTIVMGKEVRIAPVSILHGSLSIEVQTQFEISQPAPLSEGKTTVVPSVSVGSKEDPAKLVQLKDGATVDELVRGLQKIGATPREVIAILQSLQSAGALDAEIQVI
ncbi:MAG: flagellar basal body P-ring protein FlgI [Acidobacteria bacterium]|nr:flagellar basal body P-ring protein FlgI [Acidobacteriota bacterium]